MQTNFLQAGNRVFAETKGSKFWNKFGSTRVTIKCFGNRKSWKSTARKMRSVWGKTCFVLDFVILPQP